LQERTTGYAMDKDTLQQVQELIREQVDSLGLALWGVEYHPAGRRSVLRVYLDAPPGREPGPDGRDAVSVEECAAASRQISVALDVEDIVPGTYHLEVSSPGLERPFFEPGQLAPYVGRTVQVILREPLTLPFPGRKRLKGRLTAAAGDEFTMEVDGEAVDLTWEQVKKAHLVHEFPDTGRDKQA
jgi:ribosome maturation factor RimP